LEILKIKMKKFTALFIILGLAVNSLSEFAILNKSTSDGNIFYVAGMTLSSTVVPFFISGFLYVALFHWWKKEFSNKTFKIIYSLVWLIFVSVTVYSAYIRSQHI